MAEASTGREPFTTSVALEPLTISVALLTLAALAITTAAKAPRWVPLLMEGDGVRVLGVHLSAGTVYFAPWVAGAVIGGVAGTLVLRSREALTPATFAAGWIAVAGLLVGAKWQYRLESLPVGEALWLRPGDLFTFGLRLPLGLLTGGLLAGLWCLAVGAPLLATGDALAVMASTLIPIGRLGCLLAGCCMGTVCGRWAMPTCLRYPPGTEVYARQVQRGLIADTSATSLPAHPLPLYFALASLATLAILLWLLRRRVPVGTLLAVFCILRPLAKLSLEPLRADPRPAALMLGIPAAVLGTTLAVLAVRSVRRRATPAGQNTLLAGVSGSSES
jgi:phosphatidylglycerol:prolipoprotein diacylglycerol transferase